MYWLRRNIERMLLGGPGQRFLLIAALVAGVSVVGGLSVWWLAGDGFADPGEAIWWAFLRLTDPGYLGDDEGLARRSIALLVTLAGYVFFMGALVALMTTWLNQVIARLERGESPLLLDNHLLLMGWTPRSAPIIREFLLSEKRVRRFMKRRGSRRQLHIVVLVEDLDATVHADVALRLGDAWDPRRITLRAGARLRVDHLERVSFDGAAAIVLPGEVLDESSDISVLKTLMSIASHPAVQELATPPRVVAEIFDQRKAALARFAYPGELDVVPTDLHLSRLIVQALRQPGLTHLYDELLTHHRGAAIYAPEVPELIGRTFAEAMTMTDRAALVGVVRQREGRREALLAPPADLVLEAGDRPVFVAEDLDHTLPGPVATLWPHGSVDELDERVEASHLLVLGWNDGLPALLRELCEGTETARRVTVLSLVSVEERQAAVGTWGPLPPTLELIQVQGDFTLPAALNAVQPARFDQVLLVGADWVASGEAADARTIVGYLTLREALAGQDPGPEVLVELADPDNATLLDSWPAEVMISPDLVSHMLAHVTLRGELLAVFEALFRTGGPSIVFRDAEAYEVTGHGTFAELQRATWRHGHIAIGVRPRGADRRAEVQLVPGPDARFDAAEVDVVVVAPVSA